MPRRSFEAFLLDIPTTLILICGKFLILALLECTCICSVNHSLACIEIDLHTAVLLAALYGCVVCNRLRTTLTNHFLKLRSRNAAALQVSLNALRTFVAERNIDAVVAG